ncbi:MAG: serine/threonine protein kinase [Planctomycetaceae bacterium]
MRGSVPEPSAGDSPPSDGSGEVLPTAGSPGRDLLADTLPQDEAARAQARALSEAALAPPAQVPGYTLGRQIGAGAFGTVWQAIEQNTGKQVAIKFYTHRRGLDWALLNREVEKLATLHNSRDVVRLLQVGWTAEPPYYVMEYLPQGSLAGRLQPGPLEPGEAAHLAGGIARALACAHEAGILHCDLKPANVLLDAELAPRLADFGQARLSSEQSPALGTLFYMAPEQADLQATPDPRWDVYALGALLYHLLVGQPPHRTPENEIRLRQATTLEEKLAVYRQIVAQEPAPTSHQQRPGVDAQLAAIVDRCLAVDPAQRFPTARAVQEALAARAHYQSLRPALWLGVLLPLVLLAGLVPLAIQAIRSSTRSYEQTLAERALESDLVAARLLAYALEDELLSRRRFLEEWGAAPELQTLFGGIDGTAPPETRAALHQQLDTIRAEIDRVRTAQGLPIDESWFLTDAAGVQQWRSPSSPLSRGRSYAWRDYFHGQGADHPEWRDRTSIPPLTQPHLSVPFESEVSERLLIALSVPLRDTTGQVRGVLGRTIPLESLLTSYRGRVLNPDQRQVGGQWSIALYDLHSGLVLDHSLSRPESPSRDAPSSGPDAGWHPPVPSDLRDQLSKLQQHIASGNNPQGTQFRFQHRDPLQTEATSEEALAAFWPIAGSDWIAVVQEPRSAALRPVREIRNQMLGYAFAGTALVLALIAAGVSILRRALRSRTTARD